MSSIASAANGFHVQPWQQFSHHILHRVPGDGHSSDLRRSVGRRQPVIYANQRRSLNVCFVFSVSASADKPPPSLLIPLLLEGPPTVTSVNTFMPRTSSTFNWTRPSSSSRMSPSTTSAGRPFVVDTDFFFVAFTFTQLASSRNLSPILRETLPSFKGGYTDFGPLEVTQNSHMTPQFCGNLTNFIRAHFVIFRRAVRKNSYVQRWHPPR